MAARITATVLEVLRNVIAPVRVTSQSLEALRPDDPADTFEVTAVGVQVAHTDVTPPELIVSQLGVEVIAGGESGADVTQLGVEVIAGGDSGADITQEGVEVIYRAFAGCVDRPVHFRLRVRNAADDADAVVYTSLPDETVDGALGWPVMAEEPDIDAATIDPLSGKTDLGACTIRVADALLDDDGELRCQVDGAVRVVTQLLADGAGRSQLVGRRVFVEATDDVGDTWGAYWSGFLTDVALVDAITWEFQCAHTGRDDESRQVWTNVNAGYFETIGSLAGGPTRLSVPVSNPAFAVQNNDGPWSFEVTAVTASLVVFEITNRSLPTDVKRQRGNAKQPVKFLNDNGKMYWQKGGPNPTVAAEWDTAKRKGWFPRVETLFTLKNGGLFAGAFPVVSAPVGQGSPPWIITSWSDMANAISTDAFALYWPSGGAIAQPIVGDDFQGYVRAVDISEANPGWIVEQHPVDILTKLWDIAGYAYNDDSVTATKTAIGDYRTSLRITAPMSLAAATEMLCGAFGFGWRMDPTGERFVFPTRAYGAPVDTITTADLASDEGVVWATGERSKIGRVAYKFRQFNTWPANMDGNERNVPDRALDGVVAIEMEPVIAEAPTANDYGVRTQTYDVPGYVYNTSGEPLDAFGFVDAQAVPILNAYQDGVITTEIDVLPTVTALEGDVVTLDLAHRPGFDIADTPVAQRGTPELAMIVSRRPHTWGARLKLLRIGPAGDPVADTGTPADTPIAVDDSTSAAATSGSTATSITVTLTDPTDYATIAADVRVAIYVGAAAPLDNGTILPTRLDPSIGTLDIPGFAPASTVWVRTQPMVGDTAIADWSAWSSVVLDPLTGVGASGGLQTPSVLLSVDGSWNVSAVVEGGPDAIKAYCVGSTAGYPSAATVLASVADTVLPFSFASVVATLAAGSTAYVAAITEDADGNVSLRGAALITRPDGTGGGGGGTADPLALFLHRKVT